MGLALSGLAGLGAIVPGQTVVSPLQPISRWLLNNNGSDSVGTNHLVGTLRSPAYSTTAIEGTASLDSRNGAFFVSTNSTIEITGALTIDAWVYPLPSTQTLNQAVVSKFSLDDRGYMLCVDSDPRFVLFFIATGANTSISVTTSIALEENVWSRIRGVYSPSNYIRVYINGILRSQQTSGIPASIRNSSQPLLIGSGLSSASSSRDFDGLIDDVSIYNQVVLP